MPLFVRPNSDPALKEVWLKLRQERNMPLLPEPETFVIAQLQSNPPRREGGCTVVLNGPVVAISQGRIVEFLAKPEQVVEAGETAR